MPAPIEVVGDEVAVAALTRLARAAEAMGATPVYVGSPLVYAHGIEYGRHRGGRLARRAGGAFYLTRGLAAVRGELPTAILGTLRAAGGDPRRLLLGLGYRVQAATLPLVPVRTGTLRRSIHVRVGGRVPSMGARG
jgi:hypothetical protein